MINLIKIPQPVPKPPKPKATPKPKPIPKPKAPPKPVSKPKPLPKPSTPPFVVKYVYDVKIDKFIDGSAILSGHTHFHWFEKWHSDHEDDEEVYYWIIDFSIAMSTPVRMPIKVGRRLKEASMGDTNFISIDLTECLIQIPL